MEEEERAIRAMPFVTTLSFVRAVKGKAEGWRVTLTCFACREYNSCGKKEEASVHISRERPTLLACLQELRKRLEEHHGNCAQARTEKDAADAASAATVSPDAPNVLSSLTASVVMFQRRSLKEGVPWFRTSTSGLRDLRITNG
jgi:hypothetical protein